MGKFKIVKDVPPPRLVCVELNPGPAPLNNHTRWKIIWFEEDAEELKPEHKVKRVKFAKKYSNYNWDYVLFADEKTFDLGGGPARKRWQDLKDRKTRPVNRHPKKNSCLGWDRNLLQNQTLL